MRVAVALLLVASAYPQAFTPFTLTEVSRQFDKNGKLVSESRFLNALNRDGAFVSVDLDPAAQGIRQIVDSLNRRQFTVDPATRSVSIMEYPEGRGRRPVIEDCEQQIVRMVLNPDVSVRRLATSIHNVPVHLIRMHNGRTVMDVYKAPDLGCHGLRAVLWRSPDEPLEIMTVEKLRLGDPDPALFEIPEGYRISRFPLK